MRLRCRVTPKPCVLRGPLHGPRPQSARSPLPPHLGVLCSVLQSKSPPSLSFPPRNSYPTVASRKGGVCLCVGSMNTSSCLLRRWFTRPSGGQGPEQETWRLTCALQGLKGMMVGRPQGETSMASRTLSSSESE